MRLRTISTASLNNPSAKFVGKVFGCLCLLLTVYVGAFFFQIGAPVPALWWLKNVLYLKEEVASQGTGNRVLIASGSNALLGINSAILEERLGKPVANLSVSGLLGMSYITYLLDKHVKTGDTIIMPLEAQLYKNPTPFYYGYSNNVLAWAHDYRKSLSTSDLIELIIRTEPSRILLGVQTKIFPGKANRRKTFTKEDVLQRLNRKWAEEGESWERFRFRSVNRWGDMLVDPLEPQTQNFKREFNAGEDYYGDPALYVSDGFLKKFGQIREIARERGAEIIVTWSVMTPNEMFNLRKPKTQQQLVKFSEELRKNDILMHCNPVLFYFEPEFFYDTVNHLNRVAADVRTNNLADCLLSEDKGVFQGGFDFASAFKQMTAQQETARQFIKTLKAQKMSPEELGFSN